MKKKILIVGLVLLGLLAITETNQVKAHVAPSGLATAGTCKWATRETSSGWQAICIDCGVGYVCTCGKTKNY